MLRGLAIRSSSRTCSAPSRASGAMTSKDFARLRHRQRHDAHALRVCRRLVVLTRKAHRQPAAGPDAVVRGAVAAQRRSAHHHRPLGGARLLPPAASTRSTWLHLGPAPDGVRLDAHEVPCCVGLLGDAQGQEPRGSGHLSPAPPHASGFRHAAPAGGGNAALDDDDKRPTGTRDMDMVTALVLLNTEKGRINEVAETFRRHPRHHRGHSLAGVHDLAAIIRVDSNDALADVVTHRMLEGRGIRDSQTHVAFACTRATTSMACSRSAASCDAHPSVTATSTYLQASVLRTKCG